LTSSETIHPIHDRVSSPRQEARRRHVQSRRQPLARGHPPRGIGRNPCLPLLHSL